MAIINGEYGPVDSVTGRPVTNSESGSYYSDTGELYNPSAGIGIPQANDGYIVRDKYRMSKQLGGLAGGPLEFMGSNGWGVVDATNAPSGYDYRQDSDTMGSNERLRFDSAFGTAPGDVPITGLQDWSMANGWQEPDRSRNEGTLGSLFSNVAPYVGLMMGGIGAMGGFAGGVSAAGAGTAEGFGGSGMLGDSAMWGLGDAGTSGALGGSAMDFSNLGDLWNYGSTAAETGGASLEDMAIDLFNKAGTPGYTQYGDTATGLDWLKSQFGGPGSVTSNITKLLGGGGTGGSGGNSTGSNASLLSGLAKLYSAYNSEGNLKNAIGQGQGNLDRAVNWQDPNQPRGDTANRLWTENYTNPKAGYNEFMTGAGHDFTEQARAAAAKSGKRGSYLNSGKMQSDLSSLWMKNQFSRGDSLAKGFTNPRNYAMDALRDSMGLSDLYKQKGGSIGMAVGDLLGSSQARELISNITGSYW